MATAPAPKVAQSAKSSSPREVLMSPVFWLLYIMFVMVSASGLMATAQIAPIAADFNVGNQIVFWGATTLTVALIIDNIVNGAARPFFGWISDNIGREYTMAIAFGLGACLLAAGRARHRPWAFVIFAGLIFLTWGEIFTCSLHLHRHFRAEIRHRQSESALHRQRHVGLPGAVANLMKSHRQLARGVRGLRDDEFRGRGARTVRAQAAAIENDGAGLKSRRSICHGKTGAGAIPRPICFPKKALHKMRHSGSGIMYYSALWVPSLTPLKPSLRDRAKPGLRSPF